MRSWQIRNILTTIALAVWCGVATAGPEGAATEEQSAPEVQSETKQNTNESKSETKKSTAAAETKKNTSASGTKKSTTATGTKKSVKSTKATATAKPKPAAQPKVKKAAPAPAPMKAPAPEKAAAPVQPKPMRIAAPGKQRTVPGHVTGGGVGVLPRVDTASKTPDVGLQGIKDRARWAPAEICENTDKKLEGTIRGIDKEASKNGDRLVMARIASEFRIPAETILAERTRLSAPWGELLVAHTLLANTRGVTVDQLFDMRAEGMGWGQISHGLGFSQKDVATAVQAEGKVVRGQSKPDGSPSKIAIVEPLVIVDETAHAGGSSKPNVDAVGGETSAPEPVDK